MNSETLLYLGIPCMLVAVFFTNRANRRRVELCRRLETRHREAWEKLGRPQESGFGGEGWSDQDYIVMRYCMNRDFRKLNDPELEFLGEQCRRFYVRMYFVIGLGMAVLFFYAMVSMATHPHS